MVLESVLESELRSGGGREGRGKDGGGRVGAGRS